MSFKTETYQILIASPSDLAEERQAATEAVYEWNAQHAVAESIVLLPVTWETRATPKSGVRPQEEINRQLVRVCDILVGMFWTKIGSSTGVAESGRRDQPVRGFREASVAVFFQPRHRPERDRPEAIQEAKELQGRHLQEGPHGTLQSG